MKPRRRLSPWAGPCSEPGQDRVGWRWLRTIQELPPVPWVKIAFPLQRCRLFPVTRNQAACPWSSWFSGAGGKGMVSASPERAELRSGAGEESGAAWGRRFWLELCNADAFVRLSRCRSKSALHLGRIWGIVERGNSWLHRSLQHPFCVLWHRAPALIPVPVLLPILPTSSLGSPSAPPL